MTPARAILARILFSRDPTEITEITSRVNLASFRDAAERSLFIALANAPVNRDGVNVGATQKLLELNDPPAARLLSELVTAFQPDDDATVGPVEPLVRAFHEWSHSERFVEIMGGAMAAITKRDESVATIEKRVQEQMTMLLGEAVSDRRYDDMKAQYAEVLDFLTSEGPRGLPFGFAKLDRATVTPVNGNLVTIAGATGVGKSMVARNILRKHVHQGRRVALFTLEMTALEQLLALGCIDTRIDLGHAITRRLDPHERVRLGESVKSWRDSGLRINERGQVTPEYLLRTMQRYRAEGYDTFVVDHLHRVDYGVSAERDLRLRVGNLAKALKAFAMDSQAIVFLLAQLVKKSPHDEPSDADIRETATVAEESDKVLFVYRPLVACDRQANGAVVPRDRDGTGRRYFENEAPKGCILAADEERVYIKPGKQRVQAETGLVAIPFERSCGRMYDAPTLQIEAIAS